MKQSLGKKKIKRIRQLTGWNIKNALTRGGWPHGYASVERGADDFRGFVNYKKAGIWPFPAIKPPDNKPMDEDYCGDIMEALTKERGWGEEKR